LGTTKSTTDTPETTESVDKPIGGSTNAVIVEIEDQKEEKQEANQGNGLFNKIYKIIMQNYYNLRHLHQMLL
jgi:hypothetical protein